MKLLGPPACVNQQNKKNDGREQSEVVCGKESLTEQQRYLRADCSRLLRQQLRKHGHRQWTVGIAALQVTTMIEDATERKDWRYGKCHVTGRSEPNQANEDQRGSD